MAENQFLTPPEITQAAIQVGVHKASLPVLNSFLLAILAGAFIAFAAEGSNMAAFNLFHDPNTYGLGKALAGVVFPTGLMLVIVAGAELFTGNTLLTAGVLDGKIGLGTMLFNWVVVYLGNLVGSLLIAYMMFHSGLFSSGNDVLGGITVKIASYS